MCAVLQGDRGGRMQRILVVQTVSLPVRIMVLLFAMLNRKQSRASEG